MPIGYIFLLKNDIFQSHENIKLSPKLNWKRTQPVLFYKIIEFIKQGGQSN